MSTATPPTPPEMAKRTINASSLPEFGRPPINELVVSIQFGVLPNFRSAHIGLAWSIFRDRYPRVTEHPPIQPIFETFGATPEISGPGIQIETLLLPPMARFWFEETGGAELIQLQQDRI